MEIPPPPARRFSPRKTGDASPLGELESAVMDIIWLHLDEVSVSDVHDTFPQQSHIAYTTVKTTMERLVDKCILLCNREGKAYRYRAAVSQKELERRIVSETLDQLVVQFPDAVASFFVHPDSHVPEDRLALEEGAAGAGGTVSACLVLTNPNKTTSFPGGLTQKTADARIATKTNKYGLSAQV